MNQPLPKINLCSNCVNWLELTVGFADCDFEMFKNVPMDKAELLIPELFDCTEYESVDELK